MARTWRVFRTEARWRMALWPNYLWNAEDRWCWEVWDCDPPPPEMFHGNYERPAVDALVGRGYAARKSVAEVTAVAEAALR